MKLSGNWKYLGSSTYEAANGTRVHVGGDLIRLTDGKFISCYEPINHVAISRLRRIFGGNRRRALMAFAESIFYSQNQSPPKSV